MYWYICTTDAGHSCLVSSQASTKIFFIGIQDFSRIHGFIPMNASHHGKLWRASLKRLFGNCSHEHICVWISNISLDYGTQFWVRDITRCRWTLAEGAWCEMGGWQMARIILLPTPPQRSHNRDHSIRIFSVILLQQATEGPLLVCLER
jgi:hypothetical protein